MVPALRWGERGIDKQLLLIRHGLKQRGQIGLNLRGSPTKVRKAFPRQGLHTPTGQQTKRLNQRRAGPETNAQQQSTSRDGRETTHNNRHIQPTQLSTKQHLQPGMLTNLIETQPPARPSQIQVPPLLLEPAPPGPVRLQQGALGSGTGAIDLIGQQHLREQRAGLEAEAVLRRIEHVQAREVRRQQFAGETHPLEREGKDPGQRFSQGRFPHPRTVFDQQMTTGQDITENKRTWCSLPSSTRPTALIKGNSSDAAKRSRVALLQIDRHTEQTLSKPHPRDSLARMHRRSKPRREPKQQPLELARTINWLEPDGRHQRRRGRAADSWLRGQHQPLAFQPTGAVRTAAHLRHRSARFRAKRSAPGSLEG